jgi:DNA end-binding protein Ku
MELVMAALRAVWKGFLKFGSVSCGIKLIGATSESESIHFRILNRKDRLPVKAAYLDEETGEIVEAEDQIKGYETDKGDYIHIEPAEIKKLKLTSDHTLELEDRCSRESRRRRPIRT